jgi:hypothetical protein
MIKAGRELDALVAEKVMGCSVRKETLIGAFAKSKLSCEYYCDCEQVPAHYMAACTPYPHKHGMAGLRTLHHYSTDIGHAWKVIGKLSMHFRLCVLGNGSFFSITVVQEKDGWKRSWTEDAATAPLAICLAALKAVGAKLE